MQAKWRLTSPMLPRIERPHAPTSGLLRSLQPGLRLPQGAPRPNQWKRGSARGVAVVGLCSGTRLHGDDEPGQGIWIFFLGGGGGAYSRWGKPQGKDWEEKLAAGCQLTADEGGRGRLEGRGQDPGTNIHAYLHIYIHTHTASSHMPCDKGPEEIGGRRERERDRKREKRIEVGCIPSALSAVQ